MKRTLALALAVILLLATAAFADDNFNETGLPIVNEKIEVEVLASTTAADPNNFPMIQKIEEATNVHINRNCISPDGQAEKIALMWASEDLPEVFGPGTVSTDDINTYGPMGYILPLNDLIDKYCVNFNTYLTEKGILGEVKAKMTSPDGNIYAFSTTGIQYKNNMGGMFYNKTWLSQLGLEMPTTREAFVEALRKIKATDLNGNGEADEIPFCFDPLWGDGMQVGLYNFAGFENGMYGFTIQEDGTVLDNRMTEAFKDATKWLASLYQEGLMDIEQFTQSREMFMAKCKTEGNLYGFVHGWRIGNIFGEENGLANYDVLSPLKGSDGNAYYLGDDSGFYVNRSLYLTTKCEHPEVMARWVDYCYDCKISEQINAGPEGIGVAYSEDGVHYRKTVPDGFDSIAQWFTDHHFQGLPFLFPDDNLEYNEADYGVTAEGQRLKVDAAIAPYLVKNFPSGIIATAEETEELALYQTDLDTYIKDSIARWICGQQDIDATWDEYLAQCEKLGEKKVLAIKQAQYDRFIGK